MLECAVKPVASEPVPWKQSPSHLETRTLLKWRQSCRQEKNANSYFVAHIFTFNIPKIPFSIIIPHYDPFSQKITGGAGELHVLQGGKVLVSSVPRHEDFPGAETVRLNLKEVVLSFYLITPFHQVGKYASTLGVTFYTRIICPYSYYM